MKQAWLIIAHNEFDVLQRLIDLLDDEESDFFVHIDKKVKKLPALDVKKGRLHLLDNRVDVRWGTVSQIETELLLLDTARQEGPYGHYHLLSGTHLPLKPVEELKRFYDGHQNQEVVRLWTPDEGEADFKLRRFHFPLRHYKYGSRFRRLICQKTWQVVIKFQKVLGIRHLKAETFHKSDNWMSLSEAGCQYLVEHRDAILAKYRWSFCGDEYFAASELMAHPDRFRIFDCPQLLHVEFEWDTPRTFPLSAWPVLQQTGCWWARKFSA